jgi:L-iditol 2-dehydrogenase
MQAAVYHGALDLRVESVPVPVPSAGGILVKVESASICGTDLRIYHGQHRKYPAGTQRIPGHEVVGRIAAIEKGVQGYETGQRVFVAPNMGCGQCRQCLSGRNNLCANYEALGVTLDGAFAEYVRIPAAGVAQGNVIPVRGDLDPAALALAEPFACVLHGQDALHIQPGETVLVLGAGPIGLMHVLLARLRGAGKVIVSEPRQDRLVQALEMGADLGVNPAGQDLARTVAEATGGEGAEAVIVAAPVHQVMEQALSLAAIGGRINFFAGLPKDKPAIQLDANLVHYKELVVTGTTACSTGDCRKAAALLESGRINLSPLVSQRFSLAQAVEAFEAAEARNALKIVIEA